ncbi:MAG TPA: hypothetical protein GXX58_11205 [Gelria sp.]|jgi:hypothetical protein|nr:hypothetical protein [Gelria sp.]
MIKKELEESFLTIEQMGYGIIDPVLAQRETDDTPKASAPITYEDSSPILFDDVWLEEYYDYVTQMFNKNKEQEKWQDLVAAINHLIETEGFWSEKSPLGTDDMKTQVEKAIKHRIEQIEDYSIESAFRSFEGWPDKAIDILSWPEPIIEKEGAVIELPVKIYSPYGRIVLSGTIKPASGYGNSSVNNLLAQIPQNIDTHNIKARVINGELLLELPG